MKMTMEEFGSRIGITRGAVSNIEKRNGKLTNQILHSVCQEFNVNKNWLQTGNGDMFGINTRLREVRRTLNMTQQAFADKLGVKRNTVGQWECGINALTDQTIFSICREFNVNEEWLRTGNGEMFVEETPDEEFMRMAKAVASGDTEADRMIRRTLMYFYEMDDLGRKTLLNFVKYISGNGKPSGNAEHFPTAPEELEEKYPPVDMKKEKQSS